MQSTHPCVFELGDFVVRDGHISRVLRQHSTPFLPHMPAGRKDVLCHQMTLALWMPDAIHNVASA